MNFNFKNNNLIIIFLLLILIVSCFSFTNITNNIEPLATLSDDFQDNFQYIDTSGGFSYYKLRKIYYDKNSDTSYDSVFTDSGIILELSSNRADLLTDENSLYNFEFITESSDLSNNYRHYQTTNINNLINIDLSSTPPIDTSYVKVNMILLVKPNIHNNYTYIYDLSQERLNINIKLDNSNIISDGIINNTIVDSAQASATDTLRAFFGLDALTVSGDVANFQMANFGNTTRGSDRITNYYDSVNSQLSRGGYMLTGLPPGYNYNSPYYNNSFEYAMNSLSNPIVNNFNGNNPIGYSQMMFNPNNISPNAGLCNSCNKCDTDCDDTCENKKSKNKNSNSDTGSGSNKYGLINIDYNSGRQNRLNRDNPSDNTNDTRESQNMSRLNYTNTQRNINESSKINNSKNQLSKSLNSLDSNDSVTTKKRVEKNFTPSLINSEISSDLPRPILADFSKF
jgi:hypothetical protein